MKTRADRIIAGMHGVRALPDNIHYKSLREPLSEDSISELRNEVERLRIRLIVLDSLSIAASVRDLKDGSEVIKQMKLLERLGTVLAIDHVAKSVHEGTRSLPFGSIFKTNIARSMFSLTQDNGVCTLTHVKSNFAALADTIRFELSFGDGISFSGVNADDPRILPPAKTDRMTDVLDVVKEWAENGISAKDVAQLLQIEASTASNYLSTLKNERGLVYNTAGRWYPVDDQSES